MITVDANVYISALQFGGTPLRLLRAAVDGEIEIAISQPILHEVLRILRDKFGWSEERLAQAGEWTRSFTHRAEPAQTLNVIHEDPDDDRILECAVASLSDVIVSGDKDLLRLGRYAGIEIMPPGEFVKRFEK